MEERKQKTARSPYTNEMNVGTPLNLALRLGPGSNKLVPVEKEDHYEAKIRTGKKTETALFLFKESKNTILENLAPNSIRLLFYIAGQWPRLQGQSLEDLERLRNDPYGKMAELARAFNVSRKSAYMMLTKLAKELWGTAYIGNDNRLVRYIDALQLKEDGGLDFLGFAFSMDFMKDFQKGVFTTIFPSQAILCDLKLDFLAVLLSLILTEEARIRWQNDATLTLEKEMAISVETLFVKMNRPTQAPNRKDKERILKPFLKAIEALIGKGFFGKEPYFFCEPTKDKITLEAARKDGTTWKDILKCKLIWTLSFEAVPKETRARNLAHKKRAAEIGNTKKSQGQTKPKKEPKKAWTGIKPGIDPDAV